MHKRDVRAHAQHYQLWARDVYITCIPCTVLYCIHIHVLRALNKCMACTFRYLIYLSLEHACCADIWEHHLIGCTGRRAKRASLLVCLYANIVGCNLIGLCENTTVELAQPQLKPNHFPRERVGSGSKTPYSFNYHVLGFINIPL